MKPSIKIYFTDFWGNFNTVSNYFTDLISEYYNIIITKDNPDLIFYSVFGNEFTKFNCKRIFFTGENIRPNFNECDFAITFDHLNNQPRHYRLPLYALWGDVKQLLYPVNIEDVLKNKTNFCNFVYSNPRCKIRNNFFRKLSKYKKIDSGGRFNNNIGKPIENKLDFISKYKFTFAFENSSFPGYTTEKIFEPFLMQSLPIYWGNPLVHLDFNPKSFLNYYDFDSDEELIEKIIELDNNDDLYLQYFAQPKYNNNQVNDYVKKDNIQKFLLNAIEAEITPVSSKSLIFSGNTIINSTAKISNDAAYVFNKYYTKYIKNFSSERLKMILFQKH